MRRQSFSANAGAAGGCGEPQIIVEESEEEEEHRRNESPPRCVDPDSPSLNPYLLYPWRETRKHSLPTPQCTSGITASQVPSDHSVRKNALVRRLSERGGEGSGPSPKEAAFLATLSQAPTQPGGRRHSIVTISQVPSKLFTHNLQLDIMDNITEIKARKVRLKMYETSTEQVCEIQSVEGNSSAQRYTQNQKRRFSEIPISSVSPNFFLRRRASDLPRAVAGAAGIVCSNTDLISILNSLTSSATEINRCGEEASSSRREESKSRSNSFDVSILHGAKSKLPGSSKATAASVMAPSNWFRKRHLPMSKKQKPEDLITASLNLKKFNTSKVIKVVKETLGRTSPTGDTRHKVVWDDTSGTKVDAQVLGSAIEKILTAQKGTETTASTSTASTSTGKPSVSPNKSKSSKVLSWFPGNNKEQEQNESCEQSVCSSLKDLFVK